MKYKNGTEASVGDVVITEVVVGASNPLISSGKDKDNKPIITTSTARETRSIVVGTLSITGKDASIAPINSARPIGVDTADCYLLSDAWKAINKPTTA